jgi:hypothetical protein
MLLGGLEVSALLPSAALADSLSQMKPKLVFNIPAQPLVTNYRSVVGAWRCYVRNHV